MISSSLGWGLIAGLAVSSCGLDGGGAVPRPASSAVEGLEHLAFAPRGQTARNSILDLGSDEDLLVDRYEVTWRLWNSIEVAGSIDIPAAHVPDVVAEERAADGPPAIPSAWRDDIPVTGMTLVEARLFAEARRMRLPDFEEWMWCAVGPRCRILPAGRYQRGLANTAELGLARPSPVGAFESGKTPDTGLYDLVGNVWEWVDTPPDPSARLTLANTLSWPNDGGRHAPACYVGGSFRSSVPGVFSKDREVMAIGTTPGHRSDEVGLRCVASVSEYIRGLPGDVTLKGELRARVVAVGRVWGRPAVRSLDRMARSGLGLPWSVVLLEGAQS